MPFFQSCVVLKLPGVKGTNLQTEGQRRRYVIQFQDIPGDCACVVKAVMYLKQHPDSGPPNDHLCTHQMLCSWDEETANSMNSGSDYLVDHTDKFTIPPVGKEIAGKLSGGYALFDVTPAVRNWVNGDPNNGFLVTDLIEDESRILFHIWGCDDPSEHHPYLQVTFHSKEGYVYMCVLCIEFCTCTSDQYNRKCNMYKRILSIKNMYDSILSVYAYRHTLEHSCVYSACPVSAPVPSMFPGPAVDTKEQCASN